MAGDSSGRRRCQLRAVSHVELAEDVRDVRLHGTAGDVEPGADLGVAQPLDHEVDDLALPTQAVDGYDAYFGTYSVDDSTNAVTQTLIGSLSQANVGQVITRTMSVADDVLTIQLTTEAFDGEPVVRTLTWQRLA